MQVRFSQDGGVEVHLDCRDVRRREQDPIEKQGAIEVQYSLQPTILTLIDIDVEQWNRMAGQLWTYVAYRDPKDGKQKTWELADRELFPKQSDTGVDLPVKLGNLISAS